MTAKKRNKQTPWAELFGPNLAYLQEQYERYTQDPSAIQQELKKLFDQWGPPPDNEKLPRALNLDNAITMNHNTMDESTMRKIITAQKLAINIRVYGHLVADIHPFQELNHTHTDLVEISAYDLTEADLRSLPAKIVWQHAPDDIADGLEAIQRLKEIYTETLAYEFSHVHTTTERQWLDRMVESGETHSVMTKERRLELLDQLTRVEEFEHFIHRTFVGQKRFSIEGLDTLVPLLDELIRYAVHDGTQNILIGMAHRGRLNVLAHILGKPYGNIFAEFHHAPNKELIPSEGSTGINYGWTGDVKYHLGADREIADENEESLHAHIALANNPSHLEFVNPVITGFTRAAQEERHDPGKPIHDPNKALSIIVHGDASFSGEGIVAETLNLSRVEGYHVGGTIHIIANNQIGFTTDIEDARSTRYASDLAKGFEIPIAHVNADDPEACVNAAQLACRYRERFQKDFVIDLSGYRRFGHNEMDDPTVTQAKMYAKIVNHPTVRTLYAQQLQNDGTLTKDEIDQQQKDIQELLQSNYQNLQKNNKTLQKKGSEQPPQTHMDIDTTVSVNVLREINKALLTFPEQFNINPKLEKILMRRLDALDDDDGKVDWSLAETLAFATILQDGTPIRFTGQDVERGTFAHRHLILHDSETGEDFSPLHHIPNSKASFAIYNSPLSEAAVMGFEYGYNVYAPETLVLWEAQYGDFANAAQVIIDQFLAAGRAKWAQKSNLVLLLPHGYEGQGPEHSNARLDRFLALAAENNFWVVNMTSSAQYFHLLRRQAALSGTEDMRPLIVMSPKGLLRNQHVASQGISLSTGQFQQVLEQSETGLHKEKVERLVLCTGKVSIDVATALASAAEETLERVHIIRIEQLYPLPEQEIATIISRYTHLKEVMWLQEEPQNMGAWRYIEHYLHLLVPEHMIITYVGRPDRSSTAEGDPDIHKAQQEHIINQALNVNEINKAGGIRHVRN